MRRQRGRSRRRWHCRCRRRRYWSGHVLAMIGGGVMGESRTRGQEEPIYASPLEAGALEISVEVTLALLVADAKQPAVATLGVRQDLPAVAVAIPEKEAIGAVLQHWLGDLGEFPLIGLLGDDAVRRVHFLLGVNIEPVMVEKVHFAHLLAFDHRDDVVAAEPDQQRDRAGLHHLEAEELLVELARPLDLPTFERPMREKIEL